MRFAIRYTGILAPAPMRFGWGAKLVLEAVVDQLLSLTVFTANWAADHLWYDLHRFMSSTGDEPLPSEHSPRPLREQNRALIDNLSIAHTYHT